MRFWCKIRHAIPVIVPADHQVTEIAPEPSRKPMAVVSISDVGKRLADFQQTKPLQGSRPSMEKSAEALLMQG